MACVLAIETSCDETAVAVVEAEPTWPTFAPRQLSSVVASQIDLHAAYGGVVPEVASRRHVETLPFVLESALQQAGLGVAEVDAIAVTCAPGLVGSLLVGLMAAKTLALLYDKPLIGVHHLEGHLFSGFLATADLQPPCLCLLVSGGHTSLIWMKDYGEYQTMGRTRDDAAGEAFDKVARLLGLGYPGGPQIDRWAQQGDPHRFPLPEGKLDHPYDTSFSGLKTAVLRLVQHLQQEGQELPIADIAASFQACLTRVLTEKAVACAEALGLSTLLLTGGVAANRELRARLLEAGQQKGLRVVIPPVALCTDNAAMIGAAGLCHWLRGEVSPLDLGVASRMALEEIPALYTAGRKDYRELPTGSAVAL
ncbi:MULTISPECIES: tRNA (adenosine(37)-N6)-threonylcarbamoyltransferase complex transferase subunit TsaD [unclassified Synechococcus]|jgi:N6-L-threonylcarbamoyladenine synthase|uniref:tRNA (adenosine(37)-N6)-threonylcarbamoyltransferase complex transferase subunit TsaD n=1 Tax=unclassified Synechococcus TaxID=2626047 RepID=UPI000C18105F|nr:MULTISPECIES: tRNA (adenosine(37)-N6)-threonylcarbamoyltransferase complex transferase subunit TsaD [unclassified Synechococcus]PIK95065.1 O-sialoglycoprotein endopeptidase [Synechococcus sp. 60AY4M2]PIL01972.1 O-sialoglycoprotein endopeptidase [Synechococcus sp. 65AY640]